MGRLSVKVTYIRSIHFIVNMTDNCRDKDSNKVLTLSKETNCEIRKTKNKMQYRKQKL